MQKIPLWNLVKIKTWKLDANAKVDWWKYPFFTCSKDISRIDSYTYDCECVLVAWNGDLNVKYYNWKFDAYQRTYIIENNKTQDLDIKYLYYFMQSYIEVLRSLTIWWVIQYIKLNNLTDIDFPLPPLSIQKQIVQKLDKLTELINKRKLGIEKTEKLTKSIFIEMFWDPMLNEKGWEVRKLDELCNKITDGTHHSPKMYSEWYPYISAKHIKLYGIDLSNLEYVREEDHRKIYNRCNPEYWDVLYIKDWATTWIAQVNLLKYEFSMLSSLALFKTNKNILNWYYLTYFLNNKEIYTKLIRWMWWAAIKRFTLAKIKIFQIPVPPISLQNKFAFIVQKNEENIKKQKESLKKLEELYSVSMQESFTV